MPPNVMWVETFKSMGAVPTPLQWAEVYQGLSQGVVDAAEAPLSTLLGSKLYEVKKVITLTGHFKAVIGLAIGEHFFQSLPKDIQQILRRGGGERPLGVADHDPERGRVQADPRQGRRHVRPGRHRGVPEGHPGHLHGLPQVDPGAVREGPGGHEVRWPPPRIPGWVASTPGGLRGARAFSRLFFDRFEEIVGGAAFVAMTAIVFVNVVCRYVFNSPLPGSDELATLAFTWATFLGASVGIKRQITSGSSSSPDSSRRGSRRCAVCWSLR